MTRLCTFTYGAIECGKTILLLNCGLKPRCEVAYLGAARFLRGAPVVVPLRFVPFFAVDADVDALAFFTKRLANAPIFLFAGMTQDYCEDGTENCEQRFGNRHDLYMSIYKYTTNERAVPRGVVIAGTTKCPKILRCRDELSSTCQCCQHWTNRRTLTRG